MLKAKRQAKFRVYSQFVLLEKTLRLLLTFLRPRSRDTRLGWLWSAHTSHTLFSGVCILACQKQVSKQLIVIKKDNNYFYLHKICEHSRANPFSCMNSSINPVNRSLATFLIVTNFQQKNVSSLETLSNSFKLDIWMIAVYLFEPLLMGG